MLLVLACSNIPTSRDDISKYLKQPLSKQIAPFVSDACSMWPEGTKSEKFKWLECCVRHDYSYWQGGTKEERDKADQELRSCVSTKHESLTGAMMYLGVRAGGQAEFKTSYRWGYGWKYPRGYLKLNKSEKDYLKSIGPKKGEDLRKYIHSKALKIKLKETKPFSL